MFLLSLKHALAVGHPAASSSWKLLDGAAAINSGFDFAAEERSSGPSKSWDAISLNKMHSIKYIRSFANPDQARFEGFRGGAGASRESNVFAEGEAEMKALIERRTSSNHTPAWKIKTDFAKSLRAVT